MTSVFRYDRTGTLDSDKLERTPQGGIRAPARFTRSGVLEYELPDGAIRREYRPPDEVFSEASIATLADAPITHLHPESGKVDAGNYAKLAKGHVRPDAHPEGEQFVRGTAVIQDSAVVSLIEHKELCEFSAGYTATLDMTPGETPEGESYDCIQRSIRYNHVAILPRGHGRAGPEVSLRLDSSGHQIAPNKETKMELTPEDIAALKALAAAAPELIKQDSDEEKKTDEDDDKPKNDEGNETDPDKKTDEGDGTLPKVDSLDPELVESLKALLAVAPQLLKLVKGSEPEPTPAEASKPEVTAEEQELLITDSIELRDKAREVLGKSYAFRGRTNRQIREDVIRHVDSKFSLKGKSDDAVVAAFEMALARHAERADAKNSLGEVQRLTRADSAPKRVTISSLLADKISEAAKRKS